jgi:hypothetical protein
VQSLALRSRVVLACADAPGAPNGQIAEISGFAQHGSQVA